MGKICNELKIFQYKVGKSNEEITVCPKFVCLVSEKYPYKKQFHSLMYDYKTILTIILKHSIHIYIKLTVILIEKLQLHELNYYSLNFTWRFCLHFCQELSKMMLQLL